MRPDLTKGRNLRMIVSCAGLVAGCSSSPRVPDEVRVPVPVPCVDVVPARPMLTFEELAAAPVFDQVRGLIVDRARLIVAVDELRAQLEACRRLSVDQ